MKLPDKEQWKYLHEEALRLFQGKSYNIFSEKLECHVGGMLLLDIGEVITLLLDDEAFMTGFECEIHRTQQGYFTEESWMSYNDDMHHYRIYHNMNGGYYGEQHKQYLMNLGYWRY